MKIEAKTVKGNLVVVDVTTKTVSIPSGPAQGSHAYQGPFRTTIDRSPAWKLEITLNGEAALVGITDKDGKKIILAGIEAEEVRLEKLFPGLRLLRAAHQGEAAYLAAFDRMMANEQNDGVNPPARPAVNTDDLSAQYPRAALYIKAESFTGAANDRKAAAGEKAKALLEVGGSEEEVNSILNNWLGDTYID